VREHICVLGQVSSLKLNHSGGIEMHALLSLLLSLAAAVIQVVSFVY